MNVPELRFPEFNGEWDEKKFGELTTSISSGKTKNKCKTGKYNVYGSVGLIGFTDEPDYEGKYILVARVGANAGKTSIINEKCGISDNTLVIKVKIELNQKFSYYTLEKYNLNSLIFGSGQPLITGNQLKNISIKIPTLNEQGKIASFLSKIDEKIEKLEKKGELWQIYKKGMMQQLFSQKLRFKDENRNDYPDWEIKEAKEIFKNYSNKDHNGDLPVLAVTQDRGVVDRDSVDIKIDSSSKSIKSYKIIEPGDFVISLRSFQGGIEYSSIKGISSPAYTVLKPKIEIVDGFYKFYFKKEEFISRLNSAVIGIRDGKQISYSVFSEMKLLYPSIAEQEKITNFLSSIDKKIENIQKELEINKKFKKGLLQQMFPSDKKSGDIETEDLSKLQDKQVRQSISL